MATVAVVLAPGAAYQFKRGDFEKLEQIITECLTGRGVKIQAIYQRTAQQASGFSLLVMIHLTKGEFRGFVNSIQENLAEEIIALAQKEHRAQSMKGPKEAVVSSFFGCLAAFVLEVTVSPTGSSDRYLIGLRE